MWSKRFLIVGLVSAMATAAASSGAIWLLLFIVTGSRDPSFTAANISLPGFVGTLIYPACWWVIIHRSRDYGRQNTVILVVATYVMSCVIVAAGFAAFAAYQGAVPGGSHTVPAFALVLVAMGALLLAVPFAAVATPMAFVHRAFMLVLFSPTPSRAAES